MMPSPLESAPPAAQHGPMEASVAVVDKIAAHEPMATVLPPVPTREQIERFEAMILQHPQIETPTKHYFAPGLYAREMFIPATAVLTGAVHKTDHLALFVGDITVWTEHGMVRLTGHNTFVSKAGAKRVGYAHADTWCTGFFPTDKTDVAQLEADLVENPHLLQCNRAGVEFITPFTLEN